MCKITAASDKTNEANANSFTILTSEWPDNSKWWCKGDILKILLPVNLKLETCKITDKVSATITPPNTASNNSHLPITANVPKRPPRANEPVSPIKTSAFGLLNFKNPKDAPIAEAHIIATTVCPLKKAIVPQAKNAGIPTDVANPSSPSVKLYALDAPVIINTDSKGYNIPISKLLDPNVITEP